MKLQEVPFRQDPCAKNLHRVILVGAIRAAGRAGAYSPRFDYLAVTQSGRCSEEESIGKKVVNRDQAYLRASRGGFR